MDNRFKLTMGYKELIAVFPIAGLWHISEGAFF